MLEALHGCKVGFIRVVELQEKIEIDVLDVEGPPKTPFSGRNDCIIWVGGVIIPEFIAARNNQVPFLKTDWK